MFFVDFGIVVLHFNFSRMHEVFFLNEKMILDAHYIIVLLFALIYTTRPMSILC